ncbi:MULTISPECIES: DUF5752 family protein [Acidianus]|uniref:Uncharacterized protein n=1 Tax=Candidatus Acidianus copahuensis TaxID=1160895 RepID=A0A031LNB3_9CREN|nr:MULTISPECIES: DUF5752 family protein [Acidianus]EZQ06577.1 hypothetical protein CM19_07295 [Candidatus Acidianus copahuensis]NON63008.1 hypothetical protein [Acidianus sp. RZ1]
MNLDSKGKGIPFKFYAAYYPPTYTRIKANNIKELLEGISKVDKLSIFYHIFHPILSSHVVPEDLPNDFAFWLRDSLHDEDLAEIIADIQGGEPLTIEDIRQELIQLMAKGFTDRKGDYPFIFISCKPVIYPLGLEVTTLSEFLDAIGNVPARSIFYHFVYKRVIGESKTNELSNWLEENFGLIELGEKLSAIDPQTYTDEEKFRNDIVEMLEDELL